MTLPNKIWVAIAATIGLALGAHAANAEHVSHVHLVLADGRVHTIKVPKMIGSSICAEGGGVMFLDDGEDPTPGTGWPIAARFPGQQICFSAGALKSLKVIQQNGGDPAILDLSFLITP